MIANSFSKRADEFIRAVIRQRIYLVRNELSKKPGAEQMMEANFVLSHLNAYPYRTNKQMAGFWNKNANRIFLMLPGLGSPVHESMVKTYMELNQESKSLIVANLVKPQILIPF